MKRFLYYLIWTVIIGLIIYFGMKYRLQLMNEARMEFNMVTVTVFTAIFPVVIGLLLRLPKLLIEIKEKAEWTFDWVKLVTIGLPTLYLVVMSILPYTSLGGGVIPIPEILLIGGPTVTTIVGIILGYVVLDSIKR